MGMTTAETDDQMPDDQMPDDEIEEAEVVCDELDDALTALGITLPSLWVDLGPTSTFGPPHTPLVELGRCNVATARALTVALRASQATGSTR
jgi:hypothetical protein